jgi:hypothetical protein
MAVGRVAGNEDATHSVSIRYREAQFPEPDMFELHVKFRAHGRMKILAEIEAVLRRTGRDRRVEEPRCAEIHAAE